MLKYIVFIALIFHVLICNSSASLPDDVTQTTADCLTNSLESSVYCRGSRAIRNIFNNLSKNDKPIVIVRGLEIVPSAPHSGNDTKSNVNNTANADDNNNGDDVGDTDDTFLGRFSRYLRTHELNIKFSDLMTDESKHVLARDLDQSGMQINISDEARKKDKGNGMLMALALMMSKMMAVMGLGGIGALAMKALGLAMTALMMAAMVGMKSLAQQGHESSHSVQYVTADGHHHHKRRRRRRSNNITASTSTLFKGDDDEVKTALPSLVYRGWQK